MRRAIAVALLVAACRPTPTREPATPAAEPSAGAFVDAADAPPPEAEPTPTTPQPIGPDGEPTLPPLPTGNAADVNGVAIPMAEFSAIYDLKVAKYAQLGREIPVSADNRYRRSIVARLVYHEVLRQEAAAMGVADDPARLAAREAQQRHGIADWPKHLERRGETQKSLREMYVAELREEAILAKLGQLEVTKAEVQADYDQIKDQWRSDSPRVRASHILFPTAATPSLVLPGDPPQPPPGDTDANAKAKAWKVYALATKNGADFAALAREHSTGPSASNGGDIGIFSRDRMAEEFSDAAFAMKVGRVSKPVKTRFGYHIIKVTGRWPPGVLPMSALEDQIVARLRQRKVMTGRRELKDDLLAKYSVVDRVTPTTRTSP